MGREQMVRALVWIRRGLLLEIGLVIVIVGIQGGFHWAGRAADQMDTEFTALFEKCDQCWQTREAQPGEIPTFVTKEEGVERRWKKVLVDREEYERLRTRLDQLEWRLRWVRELVAFQLLLLLVYPVFRILATWWVTSLSLSDRSEEIWRWVTRLAAIATALAMWKMLSQAAHQPALRVALHSGWAQLAAILTASGTLRYLTSVAVAVRDRDYLVRNHWMVRMVQVGAVFVLGQLLLPREVAAAMADWLNLGGVVVFLLAAGGYLWQLWHLRASLKGFVGE
jgi:hypothetical protein